MTLSGMSLQLLENTALSCGTSRKDASILADITYRKSQWRKSYQQKKRTRTSLYGEHPDALRAILNLIIWTPGIYAD